MMSTNNVRLGSCSITNPEPPLSTTIGSDPSLLLISNQNLDIEDVEFIVALNEYREAVRPCTWPTTEKNTGWSLDDCTEHPVDGQKEFP